MGMRFPCSCNNFFTGEVGYSDIPHLVHSLSQAVVAALLTLLFLFLLRHAAGSSCDQLPSAPSAFFSHYTLSIPPLCHINHMLSADTSRQVWDSNVSNMHKNKREQLAIMASNYLATSHFPECTQNIFRLSPVSTGSAPIIAVDPFKE